MLIRMPARLRRLSSRPYMQPPRPEQKYELQPDNLDEGRIPTAPSSEDEDSEPPKDEKAQHREDED